MDLVLLRPYAPLIFIKYHGKKEKKVHGWCRKVHKILL